MSDVPPQHNIDLFDVPPQPPILKSEGNIKGGTSKYVGVYFNKQRSKWQAQIRIDGKQLTIGLYEIEEDAAIDYARAVFKYKGQGALDKARERKLSGPAINIDLSDVPSQLPIPKSKGRIKEGASKFTGVTFNKPMNKWHAQITFAGK